MWLKKSRRTGNRESTAGLAVPGFIFNPTNTSGKGRFFFHFGGERGKKRSVARQREGMTKAMNVRFLDKRSMPCYVGLALYKPGGARQGG